MKVRSLGYRTDLFFPAFDGEIIDRGDYLVVRTPTNPSYYWGNFLLFAQPPQAGDDQKWPALFAREIGAPPATEHQVFGWDSPAGEEGLIQPFLAAGFQAERNLIMVARTLRPLTRPAMDVSVRALRSASEWEQAVELQVVCRDPGFTADEYRLFRQRQMERYRQMSAAGLGGWYAAFAGERMVADLGIFHRAGLGRYQSVETHPDFRRRGIASRLVYEAGRQALAAYSLEKLVIAGESGSSAARLYAALGFNAVEKQVGVARWPSSETATQNQGRAPDRDSAGQ